MQREFLVLLEDAIRTPDISKSVRRYQMAVDEAKVRLDLAVVPWAWLIPSRMVLNTGSVVGYNNKLRQAGRGMKLGVNNDVNQGTKKAALHLMGGGPSKINLPNSHPSNPVHKAAQAESGALPHPQPGDRKTPPQTLPSEKEPAEATGPVPPAGSGNENHDVNKVVVAIGAVALAGILFWAAREG